MIINDNSKIIHFKPNKIYKNDFYLQKKFECERNSITKINGLFYYYKYVHIEYMINELIGTILSRILEIESANYEIGFYDNDFFALSKIFFKPEYDYSYPFDYFGTSAYELLTEKELLISNHYLQQIDLLKKIKNPDMISQILKLIAIDLKMGQVDRNDHNVILKTSKETKLTDLAPLYDFSASYEELQTSSEIKFYDNPFVILRKNYLSLYHFAQSYPEFIKYVKLLKNIQIYDILSIIEKEYNVKIKDINKEYYNEKDKEYISVLKRII